jgi:hypothetical protein
MINDELCRGRPGRGKRDRGESGVVFEYLGALGQGRCYGNNMMDREQASESNDDMQRREIILADGRYMIFYTFTPSPRPSPKEDPRV